MRRAKGFTDTGRSGVAARGLAVVTCMDSRILVLAAHLLGVGRVMVVAHTDCRMASVTDAEVHQAIAHGAGIDTRSLDFQTISDQRATLAADVQRIRSSPYLPVGLPVTGCVYDVHTGCIEVAVAD